MPAVSDSKSIQPSTADAVSSVDGQQTDATAETALRIRYRIRFAKQGLLRWISHRDLARLWERMLRRGAFQLSMTEGFHPKPRIGFPSALALGVEGLDEVVEIELAEDLPPHEVLRRLQDDHQPGLTVHRVGKLPDGFGKAHLLRSDYTITISETSQPETIRRAIDELLATPVVSVNRKKKDIQLETSTQILRLELVDRMLHLSLAASESASLRPGDVLDLLGFGDWIEKGSLIARTGVILQHDLESEDPAVMAVAPSPADSQLPPNPLNTETDRD
jgi:radical SAM-linked protein